MTTADEQNETTNQKPPTVENAAGATDGVDGAPQADAPAEEKVTPAQKRARKAAATRKAKAEADEETPAGLSIEGRVSVSTAKHDKDAIVHVYEFDNGYGAKVYQRERGGPWEWAPVLDGNVLRRVPGAGRTPAVGTVEQINDGLALVAAIDA